MERTIGEGKPQREVTEFYDDLIFPSRVGDGRYANLIKPERGEMIADFGCGQSLFYHAWKNHNPRPVFFDISIRCLLTIDYGIRVRGDIHELPFRNNTFDKIVSIGVIHSIPYPESAIEEVHRVLKKGGLFVMGVYHNKGMFPKLRGWYERLGILKPLAFRVGKAVSKLFHARKGMELTDYEIELKTRDWLLTPLVRYMPFEWWLDAMTRAGFRIEDAGRISTMNIFCGRKSL